ncbi:MAG: cryptochrome/photolyase family protein [Pyrinomonadaceae bacterium]|nr:cryptochrome/photolyase family protein [Pyrinomonadaceae bacterium]
MTTATLIFPNQLFEDNPAISDDAEVFLVEEHLFFNQYKFHKQKLKLHRASMKFYEHFLTEKNTKVNYIEAKDSKSDIRNLIPHLISREYKKIKFCDVADNWLEKRIRSHEEAIEIEAFETPLFISSKEDVTSYLESRKKFRHNEFYIRQRKELGILIENGEEPVGGKWSFDSENRERYPKGQAPPGIEFPQENSWTEEADRYVENNFKDNYGSLVSEFIYPATFRESRKWLDQFLEQRFAQFGDFEDAIVADEKILNHSVLTPILNVGLITPDEVIKTTLKFADKNDVPINSLEGFIRQIVGWREFIRGIYEVAGTKERTTNFWKFKHKIPESFWTAETGIEPIDTTIKKVLDTGYCHHIERLMILGNFMLLCEFDPDEVYRWFMELFVDSYDWVMVPNVYGMSQFADGGLMSTKPYISGSNYINKMSDHSKGDWQKTWDGLFWRFMDQHRDFFESNPRLGMLLGTLNRMDPDKRATHMKNAEKYLQRIRKGEAI